MSLRELGFLFIALAGLVFVTDIAYGQDLNCALMADMALVSRALAEDGMKPDQAERIMLRIYASTSAGSEILRSIVAAGQQDKTSPTAFAIRVGRACQGRGVRLPVKMVRS